MIHYLDVDTDVKAVVAWCERNISECRIRLQGKYIGRQAQWSVTYEEVTKYSAEGSQIGQPINRWRVTIKNDSDATLFLLTWS